jgi:hypothetical protein
MCHYEGDDVSHIEPCCKHTYEKYIVNGVIDHEKYNQIESTD